jgi:hypothetical protein
VLARELFEARALDEEWLAGFLGAHRFYLGQWRMGLLWMCTLGLFLVGWIVDAWRIPDMVNEHNREAWDQHFQTLMDGGDFELDDTYEVLDGGPGGYPPPGAAHSVAYWDRDWDRPEGVADHL